MKPNVRSWCVVLGTAGSLLALSGCVNTLTAQQRLWLARGQESYEREHYARAIEQLTCFLDEVHEGPEVARALYVRGMSNAKAGRRAQAYADLRRCVTTPGDPDSVWRAHVVLGTLQFEDGQWEQAAQDLQAATARMPATPPKDAVLYRLGLCYERAGRWDQARSLYQEITKAFAGGSYARDARRRYNRNAQHFAVQCGAFRERRNAEALCADLGSKGLEGYVRQEVYGRTPMYIVLVGRYVAYEEALSQLAMIERQFVPDAILWP